MGAATIKRYHAVTRSPLTSALHTVPLFLLYGFGVLIASPDARSGADFLTGEVLDQLGRTAYIVLVGGGAGVVVAAAVIRFRERTWSRSLLIVGVLGEGTAYALAMGALILAVLDEAKLLGPVLIDAAWVDRTVISAGAGLHEELLFRLALVPLIALIATRVLAMPRLLAVLTAIVGSSLLFAWAHHLAGEPLDTFAFAYRTLAGTIFAGLFVLRGFAVAAWTHAIYDFYVLSLYGDA